MYTNMEKFLLNLLKPLPSSNGGPPFHSYSSIHHLVLCKLSKCGPAYCSSGLLNRPIARGRDLRIHVLYICVCVSGLYLTCGIQIAGRFI
ncbi:hypothetical protein BJX63DRAFT_409743 [Aspergillus granulosus]|uniref:Uncharacterized protein n=1 Tax=Aspergillus granulosus TaxID=176169 RepID=A0ABR4GYJ5_9EURO